MSNPEDSDCDRRNKDDELAARWMVRHWDAMVKLARRYAGGCPLTAEDIAAEALKEAYRQRHRLKDPAGERAWLLAFVRRKGLEAVKARQRDGKRRSERDPDTVEVADPVDILAEWRDWVLENLLTLPEKQQEIVKLVFDGWRDAEGAAELGMEEGTYRVYKSRARKKLTELRRDEDALRLAAISRAGAPEVDRPP